MVMVAHLLSMRQSFTQQNRMNASGEVTSVRDPKGKKKATHIWVAEPVISTRLLSEQHA